jgi:ADP-ribosylglycohydrolase
MSRRSLRNEHLEHASLGYADAPVITDDTQMTLFAAEGIVRAGDARWDNDGHALTHAEQASFLRWYSTREAETPSKSRPRPPAGW